MTQSDPPASKPARGPLQRALDRKSPRPRRQVDFAPCPDFGRAGGWRNPDFGPAGGRRCPQYRQGHAGAGRQSRADRRFRLGRARGRRRRLRPAANSARFRQFRHRLPAGDGRGRRLPDLGGFRRRRLAALAADAAGARSPGIDGRAGRASGAGRPPAADAAGRARPAADPLPDPGRLGPDQVGGAAGGAGRPRRHHRDRDRGQPRPHRADAEAFWRARSSRRGKAATAAGSR